MGTDSPQSKTYDIFSSIADTSEVGKILQTVVIVMLSSKRLLVKNYNYNRDQTAVRLYYVCFY